MRVLKVLVACEFSGIVRDAFLEKGHDAWSCDLLPAEHNSNRHIQGDVRDILNDGWDFLIVAHPPCTRLCNSGVRWLHKAPAGKTIDQMWKDLREGAALFSDFWNAFIPHLRRKPSHAFSCEKSDTELCRVFAKRPALAIRASRNQAHLLLVEEPSIASPDKHCRGPHTARSPYAAVAR
jgi:hypothetical protein